MQSRQYSNARGRRELVTGARRQRDILQLMKPPVAGLRAAPGGDVSGRTCSAGRWRDELGAGAAAETTHL